MINKNMISVIIPAYNEANFIGKTLENLQKKWVDEIIVVNDGSSDRTLEIVKDYPVKLINLSKNQGKGKAVTKGVEDSKGDILVIIDADLGESVREIKKLIIPLINSELKATIGVLPVTGGGLGLVRKLAELGLKFITGKKMRAPLSGQRALRREIIQYLLPLESGFGLEMGMDISLIKRQIKFAEVECSFKHRVTGQDLMGYKHRFEQFTDIVRCLWELK